MKNFYQFLESTTNTTIIKNAFTNGINTSNPSILGFHGTSIQTIIHAIKTGFIPVTIGSEHLQAGEHSKSTYGEKYEKYGIHIVPNPKNKIVQSLTFSEELPSQPLQEALSWASRISKRHANIEKYNLDLSNPSHHELSKIINDQEHSQEYIEKKFKLNKPKKKFLQGGVALAISQDVTNEFEITTGADGNDINIITKNLPIHYIIGIEPENDQTYDWLDNL